MSPLSAEARRIRQELKQSGVTAYGLHKFATRYLPHILHEGEHVNGAVYGRYTAGTGMLNWEEGMLVATERRIIFLDRKPGYETTDELTYDVVSGVQKSYAWPFASITLHTRLGDYTIRFANKRCIDAFMHYVEKRRLESVNGNGQPSTNKPLTIDQKMSTFLNDNDTLVLSTVDRAGNAYGAVVHYFFHGNTIYILTKTETQKMHNILAHRQVALTLCNYATLQTLQLQGVAEIEPRQFVKDKVFAIMSKPRVYGEHMEYPPVTGLTNGSYIIVRIYPYKARFSEFGKSMSPLTGHRYQLADRQLP